MKVKELIIKVIKGEAPKRIYFDGMEYEVVDLYDDEFNISNTPIALLYRNKKDYDDFLFRDYGISLEDYIETTKKRPIRKVKCIETKKIFNSPVEAGRYYGFEDGDMVGKVCRGARETAKGLHFEYIEEE